MPSKVKGSKKFIDQSNAYIDGTAVVKKCNFEKHLTDENHKTAALRLKETSISKSAPAVFTIEEVPRGAVNQTLLRPTIQKNIGSTAFAARTKISFNSLHLRKWQFV